MYAIIEIRQDRTKEKDLIDLVDSYDAYFDKIKSIVKIDKVVIENMSIEDFINNPTFKLGKYLLFQTRHAYLIERGVKNDPGIIFSISGIQDTILRQWELINDLISEKPENEFEYCSDYIVNSDKNKYQDQYYTSPFISFNKAKTESVESTESDTKYFNDTKGKDISGVDKDVKYIESYDKSDDTEGLFLMSTDEETDMFFEYFANQEKIKKDDYINKSSYYTSSFEPMSIDDSMAKKEAVDSLVKKDIIERCSENSVEYEFEPLEHSKMQKYPVCLMVGSGKSDKTKQIIDIMDKFGYMKNMDFQKNSLIFGFGEREEYPDRFPEARIEWKYSNEILKDYMEDGIINDDPGVIIFDGCFNLAKEWQGDEWIKILLLNSKFYNKMIFIAADSLIEIKPELRRYINYVFITEENKSINRRSLFRQFGGIFEDYLLFNETYEVLTGEGSAMVIKNGIKVEQITECVFFNQPGQ